MTMPENLRSPAGCLRPAFLLADSRPLFAGPDGSFPLRQELHAALPPGASPCAAYLGASNGDEPAFFEIFAAAMDGLGIEEYRFVRTPLGGGDLAVLGRSDVVVLAGGDPLLGWRALEASGAAAALVERRREGAVLIGISAGAVQLGQAFLDQQGELAPMSGLLPFLIDAHDEPAWSHLRQTLRRAPPGLAAKGGLGVPFRAAARVDPDGSVHLLDAERAPPLFTLSPPTPGSSTPPLVAV